MEQRLLNYVVILESDIRTGSDEPCYSIYCPSLGLSDSGDTIEDALENMKDLIVFHLDSLRKEQEPIPTAGIAQPLIATVQVAYPS
ncbi:type II toxin-antitoxin system HicB family antitoxin [Candidatus Uhrbacteria bacterium]|nr:type II toxin-antitoxin system HicB family antitoxin [Candidatus Uhrbacteria bacterium]